MEPLVVSLVGEEKTGKSTFATTAPPPVAYAELDPGGLDRAIWRLNDKAKANIHRANFYVPQQADPTSLATLRSTIQLKREGKIANRANLRQVQNGALVGMTELWYEFLSWYIEQLDDPAIRSIVIDSGSLLWDLCHQSHLQEIQSLSPGRTSLTSFEYADPNTKMKGIIAAAQQTDKNLIFIHHTDNEYQDVIIDGKKESIVAGQKHKGWNHIRPLIDLELWFDLKTANKTTTNESKISLSGVTMRGVGRTYPNPTWDLVMNDLDAQRTIELMEIDAASMGLNITP